MLKRKKDARPRDINQLARHMVELTTAPPEPTKDEVSRVMAALGHRGGKVSGARRMTNLTAEQRSAIALKAARARWKKAKAAKRG